MIRFHLPPHAVERLAFAYSPLFEAVLSLHVLVEPKHHPLQHNWVRRMRHLPSRLRRDVHAFAFAYRSYVPEVLSPTPAAEFSSFGDDLARLRAQPAETIAFEFSVPLSPPEVRRDPGRLGDGAVRDEILRRGATLGRAPAALVRVLLDDPMAFADRFIQLLTAYWERAFAAEWERVEPLLATGVADAGGQLATAGLYGFLPRLSPELRVDAGTQTISLDRRHEHEVVVDDENPLTLIPSVYVWPHVRVNCDPPWPLALVFPAPALSQQARPALPSEELLRVLRAIGDPVRLQILRLIAEQPRSTQELAPLVGMTEAGVSRNLRLLSEAGLLETHRQGRYLLYTLVRDRLDLTAALERFLAPSVTEASPSIT
jgi:DNA-binding transcriptional ArsR family regulator